MKGRIQEQRGRVGAGNGYAQAVSPLCTQKMEKETENRGVGALEKRQHGPQRLQQQRGGGYESGGRRLRSLAVQERFGGSIDQALERLLDGEIERTKSGPRSESSSERELEWKDESERRGGL